jgi:peroxiredoxin Q/BCP
LLLAFATLTSYAIEVGDPAPDFELQGSDGELHRLADRRGKSVVVLAWFPKAYTRGCTIECKSLAENGYKIREFKVNYFMASVDPIADNSAFAAEYNADFAILSDESREVAEAYHVIGKWDVPRRETFYIGTDGAILAIDREVNAATAAEDIAATLASLGVEKRGSSAPSAGR